MKKLLFILGIAAVCGCSGNRNVNGFPDVALGDGTVVVAHRGYWKCEAAGFSENSIASLKAAQQIGCWGSECDIRLTRDGVVIVNHNADINGKPISGTDFADITEDLLPNGERRPTLDEYLDQAAAGFPGTKLVIELKALDNEEMESVMVDKTFAALKDHNVYDPQNIVFISFSKFMCDRIAAEAPEFVNQYLSGDITPGQLAAEGINGIDYNEKVLKEHPEWIAECKELGMSTNVWTVNKEEDIRFFIEKGVGAITTNEPELAAGIIAGAEAE